MKKIVVRLFGGLGNQMFQYAIGRSISIQNSMEFKLDINSGFRDDIYGRKYCLNHFNILENFASKNDLPSFRFTHTEAIDIKGKLIRKFNRKVPFGRNYEITEKSLNFDPEILKINSSSYLIGYWQNENYFRSIEDLLRNELRVKYPLEGMNLITAEKIMNCNSVGVHLRNYKIITGNKTHEKAIKFHGFLTLDYYEKAIEFLKSKFTNLEIFVFSHDMEWAKSFFRSSLPTTFISHNSDEKNYEDLRLLSLCKHQIIANSSFSWWAGWLNSNKGKIVIAPKNWFVDNENTQLNIVPCNWVKI